MKTVSSEDGDGFAGAIESGLGRRQKALPCRFLYDARGSELFESICEQPEYYLTRAESAILEEHASAIASRLPHGIALVELGSGSSQKTRFLIEALLERQGDLEFTPVDVSDSALRSSSLGLTRDYERLNVAALHGRYEDGLRHLSQGRPLLLAWLGSSIGNLTRSAACNFLLQVRGNLKLHDRVLVGIDLRKDARVLESAYNDANGATERFIRNIFRRLNRELSAEFDGEQFRYAAQYLQTEGRVEMSLISLSHQVVPIRDLETSVSFDEGEKIHVEDSTKYSLEEIDHLASSSGFRIEDRWRDPDQMYSLNLLAPS